MGAGGNGASCFFNMRRVSFDLLGDYAMTDTAQGKGEKKLKPPKTIQEGLDRLYYFPGYQGADYALHYSGRGEWRVTSMDGDIPISSGRSAMSAIRKACKVEGV